jgi:hypothetical protein
MRHSVVLSHGSRNLKTRVLTLVKCFMKTLLTPEYPTSLSYGIRKGGLIILILFLLVSSHGCKSPNEPEGGGKGSPGKLTSEDVSCTEAWLKINAGSLRLPSEVTISRDGNPVARFNLSLKDTTIYDDSLQPGKDYTYQVEFSSGMKESLSIRTMDTTSHDFSWQIFRLGDYGTWIRDVAIINDTLIYAVGEIYKNFPNGEEDPKPYSLARWDGHSWSIKRLYYKYKDYQGQEVIAPNPIARILPFGENDIWLSSGSVFHWNGRDSIADLSFSRVSLTEDVDEGKSLDVIWGTSSNDIYAAGAKGTILHFDGRKWQVIESGTNLTFYDIWGGMNDSGTKPEVLAVGSIVLTHSGRVIEKLDGLNAEQISTEGIPYNNTDVWFIPEKAYYVASGFLYYKHRLTDPSWTEISGLTDYSITDIYGPDRNDIFVTTSYGNILHFNGKSWKTNYNEVKLHGVVYSSVRLKNNLAVAVGGYPNYEGFIAIGRR